MADSNSEVAFSSEAQALDGLTPSESLYSLAIIF